MYLALWSLVQMTVTSLRRMAICKLETATYDKSCGPLQDWIGRCQNIYAWVSQPNTAAWHSNYFTISNSSKSASPYFYIGWLVAVYLSKMAATMDGPMWSPNCGKRELVVVLAIWLCVYVLWFPVLFLSPFHLVQEEGLIYLIVALPHFLVAFYLTVDLFYMIFVFYIFSDDWTMAMHLSGHWLHEDVRQ